MRAVPNATLEGAGPRALVCTNRICEPPSVPPAALVKVIAQPLIGGFQLTPDVAALCFDITAWRKVTQEDCPETSSNPQQWSRLSSGVRYAPRFEI